MNKSIPSFAASLLFAFTVSLAGKPNIILILADDLGYADITPYGQQLIKTPVLEEMAKQGMLFTDFYAGVSVCAPSRSSLVEGLHTGHSTIRNNLQYLPVGGQQPLPDEALTIAEVLQEAGYVTGMIGKWGLGNVGTTGDPLKQGWDYYYGYTDQVLAHNYYPDHLLENGEKIALHNEPVYLPEKFSGLGSYTPQPREYSHDYFMAKTIDFIEENAGRPFFLYLPYTIPHENGEQLRDERFEVPSQGIYVDESWSKEQKDYAAMISYMDAGIGYLLQTLKQAGIDENTLVFFCSDNGPMKNMPVTEFFNSNGDLRGGKRDLYEGGIRSPLIAWWPSVIKPGTVSGHICAAWDFFPTFCELAGIAFPASLDGISLLPALKGKPQSKHEFLYWEFHTKAGMQAVRMGKWKGIRINTSVPDGPIQLYDLEKDLGESNDVARMHPEIVAKIADIMASEHAPSPLFPFGSEQP